MPSTKPAVRFDDIQKNVAKIRLYLQQGGGLQQILEEQAMAYDAIRTCLLEISEAAIKLGDAAETLAPEIPWRDIRSLGNYLRHRYDDLDLAAIERAVSDLDRLDGACTTALSRLTDSR